MRVVKGDVKAVEARRGWARRRLLLGTVISLFGLLLAIGPSPAVAVPPAEYNQTYRPQFHFSAQKNWLNDPNGLVYYKGVYHLFYQYNPKGNTWGNMSWGHATSKDLVHWTEQPVAIPQTFNAAGESIEDIFSGSAVVDTNNTSGFGTKENPPMVAIYTSAYTASARPDPGRASGAVTGLQHRRGQDLDQVRRQPGARHRLQGVPRPEGVLVRARPRNGGWSSSAPWSTRSTSTARRT